MTKHEIPFKNVEDKKRYENFTTLMRNPTGKCSKCGYSFSGIEILGFSAVSCDGLCRAVKCPRCENQDEWMKMRNYGMSKYRLARLARENNRDTKSSYGELGRQFERKLKRNNL